MSQKKKCTNETCEYMTKLSDQKNLSAKSRNDLQQLSSVQNVGPLLPHKCCISPLTTCSQQPQEKLKSKCRDETSPEENFASYSTDDFHDCLSDIDCVDAKGMIMDGINKLASMDMDDKTCDNIKSKLDSFGKMMNSLDDPSNFYEGLLKLSKLTYELFTTFDISYRTTSKDAPCPKKEKVCKPKRPKLPPNDNKCGPCIQKNAMAKPVMHCCDRHSAKKSCKSEKKQSDCKQKNVCSPCGQQEAMVKPGDHGCEQKKTSCETKKTAPKPKASQCPEQEESGKNYKSKKSELQQKSKQDCEQKKPEKSFQPKKSLECSEAPKPQATSEPKKPKPYEEPPPLENTCSSPQYNTQTPPKPPDSEKKNKCKCTKPPANSQVASNPEPSNSGKKKKCSCKQGQPNSQSTLNTQDKETFQFPQTLTKCKSICSNKCSKQPKCAVGNKLLGADPQNNSALVTKGKCSETTQSVHSSNSAKSKNSCGVEREPISLKKQQVPNAGKDAKVYLIDPISVLIPIRIKRKVVKKPETSSSCLPEPKPNLECAPEPPSLPDPEIEVDNECGTAPDRCPGGDTCREYKLKKLKRRRSPNEPEMDTVHLASETTIFSFEESRSSLSTRTNEETEYLIKETNYDDNEYFKEYIS